MESSSITLADFLLDASLSGATRCGYLLQWGFQFPERAASDLYRLAGEPPLTFDFLEIGELLLAEISRAADVDASLSNFERFAEAFGSKAALYRYLLEDPRTMQVLANLFGFSQFLSDILIRNPEYFDMVASFEALTQPRSAEDLREDLATSLAPLHSRGARVNALRRFKRREMLRIGLRDMLQLADLPVITQETTSLADVLVEAAFLLSVQLVNEIPAEREYDDISVPPMAVFALGKMGGEELNYSSDIDLLILTETGDDRRMTRIAEKTIETLAQATDEGYLYRVDMRLRPHGASGALVPSFDYCLAYYESWAEPWEWQALIKARQVAGDATLGRRFLSFVYNLVFAKQMDTSTIIEIQYLKRRMESLTPEDGEYNIKLGRGGIRDIEFTVQLLQLLAGADHPQVRTGNTLSALDALAEVGRIAPAHAQQMRESYCFLRRLENCLQIVDEFPLQALPRDLSRMTQLARRMGYQGPHPDQDLQRDLQGHLSRVRALHEHYFYPDGTDRVSEESLRIEELLSPEARREMSEEILSGYGFEDGTQARENIRLMALGPAHVHVPLRTRRWFLQIAPALLQAVSESPDPDEALNQLESLCSAFGNRTSFLQSLSRNPQTMRVLATLGAVSPDLMQLLHTHPEFFDVLMAAESVTIGKSSETMSVELQERLRPHMTHEEKLNTLRRYRHREMLRIAMRDLAGEADIVSVQRELSSLAEACLQAAYTIALEESGSAPFSAFAVIALGKLGGKEIHYASDLDVAFVFAAREGDDPQRRPIRVQSFCDRLIHALSAITAEGMAFKVDARLRPEGGVGAMARMLNGYEEYWRAWMEPWERLVLLRARAVAGDTTLGATFVERSQAWNCSCPVDQSVVEALRHIKQRVEAERAQREEEGFDIKLGPGGLNDIEFTTQWLQLRHAGANPSLLTPGTLDALTRLHQHAILTSAEHEAVTDAYLFLSRLESRLRLTDMKAPSCLPKSGKRLKIIAKSLGYRSDQNGPDAMLLADYQGHARRVREIFTARFVTDDATEDKA